MQKQHFATYIENLLWAVMIVLVCTVITSKIKGLLVNYISKKRQPKQPKANPTIEINQNVGYIIIEIDKHNCFKSIENTVYDVHISSYNIPKYLAVKCIKDISGKISDIDLICEKALFEAKYYPNEN